MQGMENQLLASGC